MGQKAKNVLFVLVFIVVSAIVISKLGILIWSILLYIFWLLEKDIDSKVKFENNNVFFRIDIKYARLFSHPFVKNELIPHLMKYKYSEKEIKPLIDMIKKNYPKEDNEEVKNSVWTGIFRDLIYGSIGKLGNDRSLSFRIFNNGGPDNRIVWNDLSKDFWGEEPSFDIDIFNPNKDEYDKNNAVSLNGRVISGFVNRKPYSLLKIYLYINKFPDNRDFNKPSTGVGTLCELPMEFVSANRWEMFKRGANRRAKELLRIYKLQIVEDKYAGDVYTDELGEGHVTDRGGLSVGNEFIEFWIK